jgi:arylformamidase
VGVAAGARETQSTRKIPGDDRRSRDEPPLIRRSSGAHACVYPRRLLADERQGEFAFFAEGLLPLGINLAVIEYTLAPMARLERIVAEVRRSVRWLAEHLAEYGADPNRLYVAGNSAGGHLTAMTMPLPEVRGGIAISGIYDLEPIRLSYLNEKLALDTAEAERNSPVRHLPATAGELVVAYGTRELPELCRQSIEYARGWTERGLPGRLLPVDGADHFTILDALARPEGVLTRALLAMLGRTSTAGP